MFDPCELCGFDLWHPIFQLQVSDLSLYSDCRFPGRAILKLREHQERLEEIPDEIAFRFYQDAQIAMKAIRRATDAERINFAVLGNSIAHVHAHLIPRYPNLERFPDRSPWDDPRAKIELDPKEEIELIEKIRGELVNGL